MNTEPVTGADPKNRAAQFTVLLQTENYMDIFGNTDPKMMPPHFFYGATNIDYSTAVRAETGMQNYSVCPREWYIDARFICHGCNATFIWSASEQKAWFEDYKFWVDSCPTLCIECRKEKRELKKLRQEYDRLVLKAKSSKEIGIKKKVVYLICSLENSLKLPEGIIETKKVLLKQIKKAEPEFSAESVDHTPR